MNLQDCVRDHRLDRQIELVREHWTSVRHFWLDAPGGPRIRSYLPDDFMLGCGMPGLANIEPTDTEVFRFAEHGLTAVIIPAYDTVPGLLGTNPERHVEHIVDLVAVDLDHPDRHWRCRGEALVLGSAYLDIAGQEGEPIPVFKTPMSWLQAAGAGVAVLDWEWAPDLLLGFDLIAEDVELGECLEAVLKPNIWIGRVAA